MAAFPESASSAETPSSSSSASMTRERQIELIRSMMARGMPLDESVLAMVGATAAPAAAPPPSAAVAAVAAPPPLAKSSSEDSDDIQVSKGNLFEELGDFARN